MSFYSAKMVLIRFFFLFSGHLYSCVSSLGYSNFNSTMVACFWGCLVNGHCVNYYFKSSTSEFDKIGVFDHWNNIGTLFTCCWFQVIFLSHARHFNNSSDHRNGRSSNGWSRRQIIINFEQFPYYK